MNGHVIDAWARVWKMWSEARGKHSLLAGQYDVPEQGFSEHNRHRLMARRSRPPVPDLCGLINMTSGAKEPQAIASWLTYMHQLDPVMEVQSPTDKQLSTLLNGRQSLTRLESIQTHFSVTSLSE